MATRAQQYNKRKSLDSGLEASSAAVSAVMAVIPATTAFSWIPTVAYQAIKPFMYSGMTSWQGQKRDFTTTSANNVSAESSGEKFSEGPASKTDGVYVGGTTKNKDKNSFQRGMSVVSDVSKVVGIAGGIGNAIGSAVNAGTKGAEEVVKAGVNSTDAVTTTADTLSNSGIVGDLGNNSLMLGEEGYSATTKAIKLGASGVGDKVPHVASKGFDLPQTDIPLKDIAQLPSSTYKPTFGQKFLKDAKTIDWNKTGENLARGVVKYLEKNYGEEEQEYKYDDNKILSMKKNNGSIYGTSTRQLGNRDSLQGIDYSKSDFGSRTSEEIFGNIMGKSKFMQGVESSNMTSEDWSNIFKELSSSIVDASSMIDL